MAQRWAGAISARRMPPGATSIMCWVGQVPIAFGSESISTLGHIGAAGVLEEAAGGEVRDIINELLRHSRRNLLS